MRLRFRSLVAAVSLAVVVGAVGITVPATAATTYPSWEDVTNARANESAKQAQIESVKALITSLRDASAAAQTAAVSAATDYQDALLVAQEAEQASADLKTQLENAQAAAATSAQQAGSMFARMGRTNTFDVTASLLVDSENADDTLYKLGAIDKLTGLSSQLLDDARQDANQVTSLSEQAVVAATVLEEARADSEAKLKGAEDAAAVAAAAVAEQEEHEETLLGQLSFLEGETATVEAGYAAGVEAARKAEEERKERERAAAAKAAAEAAAAAAAAATKKNTGGGGASTSGGGGGSNAGATGTYFQPSAQGWWRPLPGYISSWYGPRPILCGGTGCSNSFHSGIDFADGCGTPMRAVAGGTVTSAGNAGAFGNRVIIDHGGGVQSRYGHMQSGSLRVSVGSQVSAGAFIGNVGDSGVATGCHLDLKIYVGGDHTNPAPFLRARGVSI
ncbi:M23 family metallopeptidase [Mycetocola sp.]|uniref:M23 family metallopeptidase n=1 Tax=Mycetocola sp. TaxID=1871042 RepID=UPI003988D00C